VATIIGSPVAGKLQPVVIYEPLSIGRQIIDETLAIKATSLQSVKQVFGNYWQLKFTYSPPRDIIEDWIQNGLFRHIEMYTRGLEIGWEGFVDQIQTNIGGLTIGVGPALDIGNKVCCEYSYVDTTISPPAMGKRDFTDWYESAESQAKYGLTLEKVLSVGGAAPGVPDQIVQTALQDIQWAQTQEQDNVNAQSHPSVTITALGYIHLAKAYTYTSTDTGAQDASAKMTALIAEDPNGIYSSDVNYIDENTTQVKAYENDRAPAWGLLRAITAKGDASFNRWMFGFNRGRVPYYRAIPTEYAYSRSLYSRGVPLTNYRSGDPVDFFDIDAGRWAFYSDILVGREQATDDLRTDPRSLFIESAVFMAPNDLNMIGGRVTSLDQFMAQLGLGGIG